MKLAIAPATLGDTARLHEIEEACFAIPWSEKSLGEFISDGAHCLCLTARGEETAEIIGYVGFQHVLDEGEIANIAVAPAYRGKGIGAALLAAVQEYCRNRGILAVHLEVRPSNAAAIALYAKCGFMPAGRRKGYYADSGEDALIYTWRSV